MEIHFLPSLVFLLFISCAVVTVAFRIGIPYSIALVLVGLGISFTNLASEIHISYGVNFHVILPPLLFYGAMHIDIERLKRNWRTIALLAVPGLLCSTFLIGYLLHRVLGMPMGSALLFGALITPTDPVSVLNILKRMNAPRRLSLILEGESLFNDGTGVVLFSLVLGILTGQHEFEVGDALWRFVGSTGGGTVVGCVLGYLAYRLIRAINDPLHEILISIVLVFGTPLVAEYFHFSGIIAVVVAGLIIGNSGKHCPVSAKTRESLDNFWKVIDFLIVTLLFITIGIELQVINNHFLTALIWPIGFTILALLLSRLIVVYPIVWIKNVWGKAEIPWSWSHVLFWGGLKGSIPIALVVGLPRGVVDREYFLTVVFAVVLFSLIVQGLTIQPLLKRLGLTKQP